MKTLRTMWVAAMAVVLTGSMLLADENAPEGKGRGWKHGKGRGQMQAGDAKQGKMGKMGKRFGPGLLMQKEDVKAEMEKHWAAIKELHGQIRTIRKNARSQAKGSENAEAAVDTASADVKAIFQQIIDEKIRHQEAMLGFMKKYRDELVTEMEERVDKRVEQMKERRGKRGKGGPRGKRGGPKGNDDAGSPEDTADAEGEGAVF